MPTDKYPKIIVKKNAQKNFIRNKCRIYGLDDDKNQKSTHEQILTYFHHHHHRRCIYMWEIGIFVAPVLWQKSQMFGTNKNIQWK